MGHRHSIAVINRLPPTILNQTQLKKIVSAINYLLVEACDVWGIHRKKLIITTWTSHKFFGYILLEMGDAHESVLGYHTLDINEIPFGIVNYNAHVKNNEKMGWGTDSVGVDVHFETLTTEVTISQTLCHEVLEMIVNPSLTKNPITLPTGKIIYREICDPVRSGKVLVDGVILSNFVYPTWFDPSGHFPFDHLKIVHHPFTLGSDQDYLTGPEK